jgi:hypothetical protein
LAETWSLEHDSYEIPNFTCIYRTDCSKQKRCAFGTIVFVKSQLLPEINAIYEKQEIEANGHLTIVTFTIKQKAITMVYRSPNYDITNFLHYLNDAIETAKVYNISKQYLIGDFNIVYNTVNSNKNKLKALIDLHEFNLNLNDKDITTDHNSLIDLIFSSEKLLDANIFESVVSDHKPVWFVLEKDP